MWLEAGVRTSFESCGKSLGCRRGREENAADGSHACNAPLRTWPDVCHTLWPKTRKVRSLGPEHQVLAVFIPNRSRARVGWKNETRNSSSRRRAVLSW